MRLDQYLYAQGLASSRERARALVMAGLVYIQGQKAEKPGISVKEDAVVEVRGNDHPYVSRGGLKLEKALQVFSIPLAGRVCMDVGASTGGFTDCMLQNGAACVYAVDVGYGQLAWKLRTDARVVVLERSNIRHLQAAMVSQSIQFFGVDVSFISLKLVLPALANLGNESCKAVCLVKPQFEAGREKVGKKGVVRDAEVHREVVHAAADYALNSGFGVAGLDFSPIRGPEGNREFLLYLDRARPGLSVATDEIARVVQAAHQELTDTRLEPCY